MQSVFPDRNPSSGIGLHTAKHLALHGAKVYFTARSEAKAQHVRDVILAEDPKLPLDRLAWLKMDLMDVRSVLDAAAEVRFKEDKVDILSRSARVYGLKVGQGADYVSSQQCRLHVGQS